jgi:hypothetical protein
VNISVLFFIATSKIILISCIMIVSWYPWFSLVFVWSKYRV